MDDEEFQDDYGKTVSYLPTILEYQRKYALSLGGNDQKACGVFKQYESHEKLRRLQTELMWVKNEQVSDTTLHNIVGKKRMAKYGGYKRWAGLMLLWISSAKR